MMPKEVHQQPSWLGSFKDPKGETSQSPSPSPTLTKKTCHLLEPGVIIGRRPFREAAYGAGAQQK